MKLISDGKPIKANDGKYRLIEDWQLQQDVHTPILIVPKGYKTDLASIPKWAFWWGRGKYDIAAIAHDYIWDFGYLYTHLEKDNWSTLKPLYFDREESDRLFFEICLVVGVHRWTAFLMYLAVRIYSISHGTKR